MPAYYRSSITGKVKEVRRKRDLRKRDFSPATLDFGPVKFYIARHFGFCYGVENAIEISYRALEENSERRVFLLSQMIHNQEVNRDLEDRGIRFIMDTDGTQFIPWDQLRQDDVVIVPAFGTTVEIENLLSDRGIAVEKYNTTCPFVEKVWNRSEKLAQGGYTTVIHGKPRHEETRATFSHSAQGGHAMVIRDMKEAELLGSYIRGERSGEDFLEDFKGRFTPGFDPAVHLNRVGVVNQTTMLATETQAIADYIRSQLVTRYGLENAAFHIADTRDTLCYATNDNQDSTYELLKTDADIAIVVGGYNSSNTSHIVELCEKKFPTYFINSAASILSKDVIQHFDYTTKKLKESHGYLPRHNPVKVILTSGASCPDTVVDQVMLKILEYFPESHNVQSVMAAFESE
ncbi:4-hydroxy-3-methylbut-2-enyl diphosphate reductase [Chryseolinea sp. T2]|uniref:4-hydroxy-3-methylbut-2-enyl diphosphate reductase n=1 Tax=Chryseolinea sp. T2 TaxID=3129255 RepID=UPI0030786DD5